MSIEAEYIARVWKFRSLGTHKKLCDWPFKHIPRIGESVRFEGSKSYEVSDVNYNYEDIEAANPVLIIDIWVK